MQGNGEARKMNDADDCCGERAQWPLQEIRLLLSPRSRRFYRWRGVEGFEVLCEPPPKLFRRFVIRGLVRPGVARVEHPRRNSWTDFWNAEAKCGFELEFFF